MQKVSPVRDYRISLGLTQAELARELDKKSHFSVTRQDINKMELGSSTPKSRQLEMDSLKFLATKKEEIDKALNILEA